MVISVEINNCIVKKTLVDQGSSADILYWKTFERLGILEQELTPYDEPLVGFSGERVDTRGTIDLYTYFGEEQYRRRIKVRYVVVHANTSYNILLGRPSLNKLRAIVSTPHLAMKFPSEEGTIITLHADQKTARECYFASLKVPPTPKPRRDVNVISDVNRRSMEGLELDPRMEDEDRVEPIETTIPFQLGKSEEHVTYLSSQLSETEAKDIRQVLQKYSDLFAWTAVDMPGIDPDFHYHRLSVRLMDKIFRHQIGTCLEVYVDDMVIKSNSSSDHLKDLSTIFDEVRRHHMWLNPAKCTFGVVGGKFLGFMLSKRGIEANPDKCQAIISMKSPHNIKEVQRLAGRIASLAHGSSKERGSGAGIILEGPGQVVIEQSLRFGFKMSNNQAEYEALLAGLREPTLLLYFHAFQKLKSDFEDVQVKHTPRELNTRADQLAKLASSKKISHLRSMMQQELHKPSITQAECLQVQQGTPNWMTGIVEHLTTGSLPTNPLEAKKMKTVAGRYTLIAGELYKRGMSTPLLKCLAPEQAQYVVREIHEDICGTHSGGRTLATKVIRAGYYWPTLLTNCVNFVQQCKPCQQHGPLTHQPPEELHSITTPWPFSIWDMDILGPFPPAKGQVKFLLVAVDHFTKWIEAEAVATITASNVQKFFWKNVITRFGIPYALITDNGLQFTDRRFNEFLARLGIKHKMTSVEHP
uniref:Gypsy retrotransposon integrase-like protein 1 n=1 Tax=Cajanus cajan TaxID=3821 RepID=A0A151QTD3_CAJCA|nr:Gypsy retrotransposon integrase-like protein 1 [Cajanus cajan]